MSSTSSTLNKRLSAEKEPRKRFSGPFSRLRRQSVSRCSSTSVESACSNNFSLSNSTIDFIQESIRRSDRSLTIGEDDVAEQGSNYYDEEQTYATLKLRKDIRLYLDPETYPSLSLMHLLQARNHFEESLEQLLQSIQIPEAPQPENGLLGKLRRMSSKIFNGNRSGRPNSGRKSAVPPIDPVVATAIAELERYLELVEEEINLRTADCPQATV